MLGMLITMTLALGTSMPTSMTVVATRRPVLSPPRNRRITVSRSFEP